MCRLGAWGLEPDSGLQQRGDAPAVGPPVFFRMEHRGVAGGARFSPAGPMGPPPFFPGGPNRGSPPSQQFFQHGPPGNTLPLLFIDVALSAAGAQDCERIAHIPWESLEDLRSMWKVPICCGCVMQGWETPEQCRASSISSGSSMELPQLDSPNSPLVRAPLRLFGHSHAHFLQVLPRGQHSHRRNVFWYFMCPVGAQSHLVLCICVCASRASCHKSPVPSLTD